MIGTLASWLLIVLGTPVAVVWRMFQRVCRPRHRSSGWHAARTATLTLPQARRPY